MAHFFSLLASIPKLLDWVEKVSVWLIHQIEQAQNEKELRDLHKALAQSKKYKDTSGLDQLWDPTKGKK